MNSPMIVFSLVSVQVRARVGGFDFSFVVFGVIVSCLLGCRLERDSSVVLVDKKSEGDLMNFVYSASLKSSL